MANDENLTPFEKGHKLSTGRPKGSRNRSTIYRELIEQAALAAVNKKQAQALSGDDVKEGEEIELNQQTIADQVAAAVLIKALGGDIPAAREVMDSAHGKLTDKIEQTGNFSRMGRVTTSVTTGEGDQRETKSTELEFDVGLPPAHESKEEEF